MRSLGSGPRSRVTPPLSSLAGIWKPIPIPLAICVPPPLRAVPSASSDRSFSQHDGTQPQLQRRYVLLDGLPLGLVPLLRYHK